MRNFFFGRSLLEQNVDRKLCFFYLKGLKIKFFLHAPQKNVKNFLFLVLSFKLITSWLLLQTFHVVFYYLTKISENSRRDLFSCANSTTHSLSEAVFNINWSRVKSAGKLWAHSCSSDNDFPVLSKRQKHKKIVSSLLNHERERV